MVMRWMGGAWGVSIGCQKASDVIAMTQYVGFGSRSRGGWKGGPGSLSKTCLCILVLLPQMNDL